MKIFVNYRPGITDASLVRRLKDCLLANGGSVVEVTTSAAAASLSSDAEINRTVSSCDAFVAVIGPGWADVTAPYGRLLDDPADPVRVEIVAALNRIMPVVPVLVDGATLPEPYDIDKSLQGLTLRDGITIESTDLEGGCARLMELLAPGASSASAKPIGSARKDRSSARTMTPPDGPKSIPPVETQPPPTIPRRNGRSTLFRGAAILIIVAVTACVVFIVVNVTHMLTQLFELLRVIPQWL